MVRVGAIFNPHPNPPESFRAAVEAAEAAGLPELWVWEDCFRQSAFAQAASALAWTERLHVGIGIAPMPLRNVALTAMEIATVARMFPGRLLPGVGHGVQSWMEQVGSRVASPLTLMREYVPALRALLAGEAVTTSGRYTTLNDVRLDWPPEVVPPVFAAAEGPKTLRLSGAVADGTVLDSRRSPAEVAEAVTAIRAGREEAGRDGRHDVVAYVIAAFGDGAEERVRTTAADRGINDDRAVWGTTAAVAEAVGRFADADLDGVILLPATGEPDVAGFYGSAGEVARLVGA